jgi:putative DNA primase/helicase
MDPIPASVDRQRLGSSQLVRQFLPSLEVHASPAPALPHQTVRQYLGAFGKNALRKKKKLDELVTQVRIEAELFGRKTLVITHLEHERAFACVPNTRTLHFGDVAGDDDFGDVDFVFSTGGPFAPTDDIAKQASAEAGRLIDPAKPVRTPCVGLLADGRGVQFERLAYVDPMAQAVLEGTYDQAFVQGALGRGRGINRGAATPLEIGICGNVPLPVAVDAITRWRPASRLAKMLLAGFVPLNAADMARFYPELFHERGSPLRGSVAAARPHAPRIRRRARRLVDAVLHPGHRAAALMVSR